MWFNEAHSSYRLLDHNMGCPDQCLSCWIQNREAYVYSPLIVVVFAGRDALLRGAPDYGVTGYGWVALGSFGQLW